MINMLAVIFPAHRWLQNCSINKESASWPYVALALFPHSSNFQDFFVPNANDIDTDFIVMTL